MRISVLLKFTIVHWNFYTCRDKDIEDASSHGTSKGNLEVSGWCLKKQAQIKSSLRIC